MNIIIIVIHSSFIAHPPPSMSSPIIMSFCFIAWLTEFNQVFPHGHGCGAIHWNMDNWPVAIPLKKMTIPPTAAINCQYSLGRGKVIWTSRPSRTECWWIWSWQALCRSPQLLCVREWNSHSQKTFHIPQLYNPTFPFFQPLLPRFCLSLTRSDMHVPLRAEHSTVSYSQHLNHPWPLTTTYCKKTLLWPRLRAPLDSDYKNV